MTASAGTKVELLPCPFCGGHGAQLNVYASTIVACVECQATVSTEYRTFMGRSVEAWNRRAAPSAPVQAGKLVGKLRAYIPVEGQDGLRIRERLMREAAAEIERLSAAATVEKVQLLSETMIPLTAAVLAGRLRKGMGSALGRDVQVAAYQRLCNEAATEIERLSAGTPTSDEPTCCSCGISMIRESRACKYPGNHPLEIGEPVKKVDAGSAEPVAWHAGGVQLNLKQAHELLEFFGGEPANVTLKYLHGEQGDGIHVWDSNYPEEGTLLLSNKADDEWRPPAPKTAWIDAATVGRNSRPAALKVSDQKVRESLQRLVALKDVKESIESGNMSEHQANFLRIFYEENKEAAWQQAREALELAGRK